MQMPSLLVIQLSFLIIAQARACSSLVVCYTQVSSPANS
jgi:hypothetical protein